MTDDRSPDIPNSKEWDAWKESEKILKMPLPYPEWKTRHLSRCRKAYGRLVHALAGFQERNDCDIEGFPKLSGEWQKLQNSLNELHDLIKRLDPRAGP